MLLRISLILAILAGLGAGGLAYYESTTQIPAIEQQRDNEKTAKQDEITAHTKTKGLLAKANHDLAQTKQDLEDTKTERDKAVARADAQEKRAEDLGTKLAKANSDLQEATDQLVAYKASGLSADDVVKLKKQYLDAEEKVVGLTADRDFWQRKFVAKNAQYEKLIGVSTDILLPAGLRGKILVVDPKWDFVVLNIGAEQGAVQDAEMLVYRDTKLVAKVIIRSVQKDRCIANIIPSWKLGEVMEGDDVMPAHAASS